MYYSFFGFLDDSAVYTMVAPKTNAVPTACNKLNGLPNRTIDISMLRSFRTVKITLTLTEVNCDVSIYTPLKQRNLEGKSAQMILKKLHTVQEH